MNVYHDVLNVLRAPQASQTAKCLAHLLNIKPLTRKCPWDCTSMREWEAVTEL